MTLPEGFPFKPVPTDCTVMHDDDGQVVLYFMTPSGQHAFFIRWEAWEQIVQAAAAGHTGLEIPQRQGLIIPPGNGGR